MKKYTPQQVTCASSSSHVTQILDGDAFIQLLLTLDPSLDRNGLDHELDDLQSAIIHARSLLSSLPSTLEEVKRRSLSVSLFALRASIFALVSQERLTTEEADQLAPLSRVMGLGRIAPSILVWLRNLLGSTHLSLVTPRSQLSKIERGLALLFHSPQGQRVFEELSGEDRVLLCGPWVRPMMRLAPHELFPRHALLALFRSTQQEHRMLLIELFERSRRRVGCSPLPAYQLLLEHLNLIELEKLFGHIAATGELPMFRETLLTSSPSVRRAFDQAVRSVSEVS